MNNIQQAQGQFYTVKQAADVLTISVNTIRSWIWQRRIAVVRLGRTVRIPKSEVDALIERNYQKATRSVAL
jgi:excisionase family DNA binding protein